MILTKPKRIKTFSFAIILAVTSIAQTLSISPETMTVSSAASNNNSFHITSGEYYWAIYGYPYWLRVDTVWFYGDKTVKLFIAENPFVIPRIANVTIALYVDWTYFTEKTLKVTQSASAYGLSASTLSVESYDGSGTPLKFTAEDADTYWVIDDLPSWLTVNQNWQKGDAEITVSATENPLFETRTGTFIFRRLLADSTYLNAIVTVNQNASEYGISKDRIIIGSTAGSSATLSVKELETVTWSVSGAASWYSLDKTSSSGIGDISITAIENTMAYYRSDTITVNFSNGKTASCILIQEPAEAVFSLSPNTISFTGESGANQSVSVSSNTSWGLTSFPKWINSEMIYGFADSTFDLSVQPNNSGSTRTGTILAYWFDADNAYYDRIYQVTQTTEGYLSIEYIMSESDMLVIAPNPVSDSFSVMFPGKQIASVSIYSTDGRLVYSATSDFGKIDISNLPNALYSLVVSTSENRSYSKIISKKSK